ncbi:MAG: transposase [Eubacteriaceae bacterium]|nr:transposase [Eubacteriaceae bacterium]
MSKTFECARFVYNKMLADKIAYYKLHGEMLRITPAAYKGEFEWLREVDSLALCSEQRFLEGAFKRFFESASVGFPKFKAKRSDRQSYTTNAVNNNIRIEGRHLVLPKLGKVRIRQHRQIPEGYRLKSAAVSRDSTGAFYVSLLFEYESEAAEMAPEDIQSIIGLDFSMPELYITSEGESAEYPKYFRASEKKIAKLQRELSLKEKGSSNYIKKKAQIAKAHKKAACQRKDFLHKRSRKIANSYDCAAIEDLNMHAMAQALNFGKSVSDAGWGMFIRFLKYKLEDQGKILAKVGKWYPSSKTCSVCGAVKKELGLSERTYACECCGSVMDRDAMQPST